MNEYKNTEIGFPHLHEIPHCVRNDNDTTVSKGKSGGGGQYLGITQSPCAAAALPSPCLTAPSSFRANVVSEKPRTKEDFLTTEATEESRTN
jgi:hypothetical protein